jgi:O-antigen ligase
VYEQIEKRILKLEVPAVMTSLMGISFGALFLWAISELGFLKGLFLLIGLPVMGLLVPMAVRQATRLFSSLGPKLSWWHILWLLVFASALQFRSRTSTQISESLLDPWAAYRVALMVTTAVVLAGCLFLRRTPWIGSSFRGPVGAMAVYCCLCIASTLWSNYPAWTLYKSLEYSIDIVLIAAIFVAMPSALAYKSLFDWTYLLFGLLLASVWVGVVVSPGQALIPASGVLPVQLNGFIAQVHPNTVGELGAIFTIAAVSRLLSREYKRHNRALLLALLSIGAATMILAQTRSAIIGFFFGLALVLYFSRRLGLIAFLGIAAVLLVLLTDVGTLGEEFLRRGQSTQLLESLSGRVDWWEFGWHEFLKQPWIGLGAYTGRFEVLAKLGEIETSSIHNTYLDALINVGVVGLLPLIAALLGIWYQLMRTLRRYRYDSPERRLALEAVGILSVLTVRSFFTTGLIWHPSLFFLLILGYAELLRRQWKHLVSQPTRGCAPLARSDVS